MQHCKKGVVEIVTIVTDSLACMYIIGNALQEPRRCLELPHLSLNQSDSHTKIIGGHASALRSGLNTTFVMVKSHIGVEGNEIANKLANVARDPAVCQLLIYDGNHAFEHRKWPCTMKSVLDADGVEQRTWRTAANLLSSIKHHVAGKFAKGLTPHGQCYSFWQAMMRGLLWNKNMAFRQKMPYCAGEGVATNANCPLCGSHDGMSHMLWSCTHPMMKALFIERHNIAARMILKLLTRSGLICLKAHMASVISWLT